MTKISIVSGCYNEEANITDFVEQVSSALNAIPDITYELIIADNDSSDNTLPILKQLSRERSWLKIIVNARNFGPSRSHYHAFLQATGDAVILMSCDLQDPPVLISQFLKKWREGYQIVLAKKDKSDESPLFYAIRGVYYRLVKAIASVETQSQCTGFGLYDQRVLQILREVNDPNPYLRGLVCEIGLPMATVPFHQPLRKRGFSKMNFSILYDIAMLGLTEHSRVPLRMASMMGFAIAILCLITAGGYGLAKLFLWNSFSLGIAPVVVGIFFLGAVQLIVAGMIGEYIGSIHGRLQNRPVVVERERVNFTDEDYSSYLLETSSAALAPRNETRPVGASNKNGFQSQMNAGYDRAKSLESVLAE